MNTQTLSAVRGMLAAHGIEITYTDFDEYRVNFKGGKEATAYYTTSIEDAADTGKAMARAEKVRA